MEPIAAGYTLTKLRKMAYNEDQDISSLPTPAPSANVLGVFFGHATCEDTAMD